LPIFGVKKTLFSRAKFPIRRNRKLIGIAEYPVIVLIKNYRKNFRIKKLYTKKYFNPTEGNLPYSSTMEDLKELFAESGPVKDVRILKNKETSKPRGNLKAVFLP